MKFPDSMFSNVALGELLIHATESPGGIDMHVGAKVRRRTYLAIAPQLLLKVQHDLPPTIDADYAITLTQAIERIDRLHGGVSELRSQLQPAN